LKKAFYSSLFVHGLVFVFISVTLPEIKTKELDYISVEIIHEEIKEVRKVIEVKEVKKNKVPIIKVAPPKQKPRVIPKNIIAEKVIKKSNIKLKPPQKKPRLIKLEEKTEKKIEKPVKTNDDEFFDDMLKNLAENKIKPVKKSVNKTKNKPIKTKEEIKYIKKSIATSIWKQIHANYIIPPGREVIDIAVHLIIYVKPDGTITRTIVDKKSLKKSQNSPRYLVYVEAAQRAIRKLGKFKELPQEEYNSWKIINIRFTPFQT